MTKTVLLALVNERLEVLLIFLKRRLIWRDPRVNALVVARVMEHQRRRDLRHVRYTSLPAIECDARV